MPTRKELELRAKLSLNLPTTRAEMEEDPAAIKLIKQIERDIETTELTMYVESRGLFPVQEDERKSPDM